MKAIYFGDMMGDLEEERDMILSDLHHCGTHMDIEIMSIPPFKRKFDVLFFDWGGMSVGNDMIRSFCRDIIQCAEDNPGRIFIMVSQFTSAAMTDALIEFTDKRPTNIYLNMEQAMIAIKVFGEHFELPPMPKLALKKPVGD